MKRDSLLKIVREVIADVREVSALRKRVGAQQSWDVGAAFISAQESKHLCQTYLGKTGPTDVLSFPASHEQADFLLGDLAICLAVARKQARELKHPLTSEVRALVVHGVLHLLGFDHEKGAKPAAQMRRWEERLLGKKGLIGRTARPMLRRDAHSNARGPRQARRRKR